MAVSSTTSKVSYSASSSQTVFAYTFKIFADADLKVYVNDVQKTLTTDYTVSDAGETSGGNVTFGTGLTAADSVVIERVLTLTQGTDYVENDPFPAETHEDALDRLTFVTQQHQDALDRTVKFATTVTDAGDVEVLGSVSYSPLTQQVIWILLKRSGYIKALMLLRLQQPIFNVI
jgi:hypothetical protein